MVTVYGDASGPASPYDDDSCDRRYWAGHRYEHMAEVMAISDVFLALTVVFLGCVGLAALMRRPAAAGAGGGGH